VLSPFLVSRAIVFVLMLLGSFVTVSSTGDLRSLSIRKGASWYAALSDLASLGDAAGYRQIAVEGYVRPVNRAYFPGFPLTWRMAAMLFREYPVTGILISNICFLAALWILYLLCLEIGCTPRAAERAVFYACFYPVSHFFSLPLTESLFFLLSIGTVYLGQRKKWALAGMVGIGAAATRLVGLMTIPALVLIWWQHHRRLLPAMIYTAIPVLGFAGFCAYLYVANGDALGFLHAQSLYGHSMHWGTALPEYLRAPRIFHAWGFYPLHIASIAIAGSAFAVLIRRGNVPLAIYLVGCVAVPLSVDLGSMTRYVLGSFPVFIGISYLTENQRIDSCVRAVSISLFAVMSLACGFHFGLAMT
jgi:hypothetical protein